MPFRWTSFIFQMKRNQHPSLQPLRRQGQVKGLWQRNWLLKWQIFFSLSVSIWCFTAFNFLNWRETCTVSGLWTLRNGQLMQATSFKITFVWICMYTLTQSILTITQRGNVCDSWSLPKAPDCEPSRESIPRPSDLWSSTQPTGPQHTDCTGCDLIP